MIIITTKSMDNPVNSDTDWSAVGKVEACWYSVESRQLA